MVTTTTCSKWLRKTSMSTDDWAKLEDDAARKISEAMKLLNERRWSKATAEEREEQGRLMRAAKKAKARKRGRK